MKKNTLYILGSFSNFLHRTPLDDLKITLFLRSMTLNDQHAVEVKNRDEQRDADMLRLVL